MSKTTQVQTAKFKFFALGRFIPDVGKYYHVHIPKALSNLLGISALDSARISVNVEDRAILIQIEGKKK